MAGGVVEHISLGLDDTAAQALPVHFVDERGADQEARQRFRVGGKLLAPETPYGFSRNGGGLSRTRHHPFAVQRHGIVLEPALAGEGRSVALRRLAALRPES